MRLFVSFLLLLSSSASLAHWNGSRPDGHAPISVMGDHTHAAGEWMVSYRYMGMWMGGNRDGHRRLSDGEALTMIPGETHSPPGGMAHHMKVLPTEMTMHMHMLGMMYAPSDRLTLMVMLPWTEKDMTMLTEETMLMGGMTGRSESDMKSDGFGDIGLSAMLLFLDRHALRAHLTLGVGIPTGSITEESDMVMGSMNMSNVHLPYGMQIGSGSHEARPALTLLGQSADWSWGAQAGAALALDDNSQGYRLGDRYQLTGWVAHRASDALSVSLLLRQHWWGEIRGRDRDLATSPALNPAADPDLRDGRRLDAGFGINLLGRAGGLKGHRLAVEYLVPIEQRLDGPQMETDRSVMIGWQKAFGG